MRHAAASPLVALTLLAAAACATTEKSADTTTGGAGVPVVAATPAPAPLSATSLAGRWTLVATPIGVKDTTPTIITLDATGDTATWTQTYPGQAPVPIHVRAEGDSLVTHAGPYASFRRRNVKVTTDGVWRLQDGRIVGTTVAHYTVPTADSVLHLRMSGTRMP